MKTANTSGEPVDASAASQPVSIVDSAPKRVRDWSNLVRAVIAFAFTILVLVVAVWLRETASGIEGDVRHAGTNLHWLVQLPLAFILSLTMVGIVAVVFVQLLMAKLWLPSVTAASGLFAGFLVSSVFAFVILRFPTSPLGTLITHASNWFGTGPFELFTTIGAFLTAANNRSIRTRIRWTWDVFYALAFIVLASGGITLTSLLVSLSMGYALGLALRFSIGTPSTGAWGQQLVTALQGVGFDLVSLVRQSDCPDKVPSFMDDLSDLSRLYTAVTKDGRRLVVSVNDEQEHAIDYLSQLWKTVTMEGLTIRKDRSARDMTEHHLTMLLSLGRIGLPVPDPIAIGATGESTFLVFNQPEHPVKQADLAALSDGDVVHLLTDMETAHSHGISHRELTPACIGRAADGTPVIGGWSYGDIISTNAHKQIDRVQLLALLSTALGIDRTISLAQKVMTRQQLASIAPYTQSIAVPKPTKQATGWNKHLLKTLRSDLEALNPTENLEAAQPVQLARFSVRRFVTALLVVVALVVVFTQLNFEQVIKAVKDADPWWGLAGFLIGLVSWSGSGIAFGSFIDPDKRKGHYLGILGTQAAASFTAVSMPALAGPVAVNFTFLRKIGYQSTRATAITSADMVAEFTTTLLMFIILGVFTGQNALQNVLPGKTVIIVIGLLGAACAVAMIIPPVRVWVHNKVVPTLRSYSRQLLELFSHPTTLLISMCGSIIQNTTLAMAFWFSLFAFNYHADFIETIFLFLLANAIGQAIPTPGGLGAIEAVLSATFIGIGVPPTIAVSATLLFRVETYWLRMVLGGIYMKWMEKKNLL
ncbi:MAG: flippase-like domain-containing protein [Aeriscardovia sp.]|nr:flippase-like domain-containing protein [Aeriscardovia sp.]